jgi:hypothetical protein
MTAKFVRTTIISFGENNAALLAFFGYGFHRTRIPRFMGSGSTYKAAYQEGLHFIGIEISEPYCAIAIKRVAQNVFTFSA